VGAGVLLPVPRKEKLMSCPFCGSDNVDANFVDIGVGEQQVTAYCCFDCHACQLGPNDHPENAEQEFYGWARCEEHDHSSQMVRSHRTPWWSCKVLGCDLDDNNKCRFCGVCGPPTEAELQFKAQVDELMDDAKRRQALRDYIATLWIRDPKTTGGDN
jgi:hypothetical protein